ENVIDQIFKNNWKNTNLVPKISKKVALSIPNIKKTEAFSLNKFSGSKYILGEDLNEMPAYIPFLNYKDNLYKFVGIKNFINFNEKTLKETYEQRAIYIKTNKLGYNHRGKRIVEYDIHDTGKESFYLPNNVKHDQKIESLYYSIEYYPSSTEEMIEETTIPSVQPQADLTIKRNFVELENRITDFEPEVQALFQNPNPTIEAYNTAIGNYEFDLSAELTESLRKDIESKLRDIKNSFTIVPTTQQEDDDIWKDEDNDCPIPF
ncbi:MAG: hypothetical protein KAJ19_29865, partial [Gammaproteobacteria bacterium]|nr:hypothetical protein [Gammaproteobacteria bacterium]